MNEQALRLIAENKRTRATKLDLGSCGLNELPIGLFDCIWLTELILSNKWWDFAKRKLLKSENEGERNSLSTIPGDIIKLQKLQSLKMGGFGKYKWQISDIRFLESLTDLKSLDLGYLNISNISFLKSLTCLQSLCLCDNHISDISFLKSLTGLQFLDLRYNEISDISCLRPLIGLQSLDIRYNLVSHISLSLIESLQLEPDVEEKYLMDKGKIYILGNKIKNIPEEVLREGRAFTIQHLRSTNKQPLNECKVIITGRGSAGKTSLQKRLFGKEAFDPAETETHGIRKHCWEDSVKSVNGNVIKVHFWDMGGQQNQQTLHQLFYSENTVYILLLDKRKDESPEDFLELIKVYGNSSHVIIAINNKIKITEKGNNTYDLYPEFDSILRDKYPNIVKTFGICCAKENDRGIINLRNYLIELIPSLDHVREEYDVSWIQVKNDLLNSINKSYIKYDDYKKLCESRKVNEKEIQLGLAKMLNNTGTITFFNRPFLGDYYILNPDWVTTGAYHIMLSPITAEKKGRISYKDLATIFYKKLDFEYAEQDYEFLMNLMKAFSMCHEFKESQEWLIPSSLKGQSNSDLVEYKKEDYRLYSLQYYISLPQSIIHRFIASNIGFAASSDYWRNGIVLKHPESETTLFVEADYKDKVIRLWIKGKEVLEAWKYFRKDFTNLSQRFEYDEMVAVEENGNAMMSYRELTNLKKKSHFRSAIKLVQSDIEYKSKCIKHTLLF